MSSLKHLHDINDNVRPAQTDLVLGSVDKLHCFLKKENCWWATTLCLITIFIIVCMAIGYKKHLKRT